MAVERARALAAALLLSLLGGPVRAGEPPAEPILRLETRMHTATIHSISADKDGRYFVTGSSDKTVRVWSGSSGALLRTLRVPIAQGAEGEVHAVALSPDGRLVAAGGATGAQWDGTYSVYLFDRNSGRMLRRIGGLPHTVSYLAFSRDGARLAVALGQGGVRLFRMPTGEALGQVASCGDDSPSADFDGAGRLLTVCRQGMVRIQDGSLEPRAEWTAPPGKVPHSARFSPDGKKIAVGYENSPQVDVLSAVDLHLLYQPKAGGVERGLGVVAWSSDGALLYATGEWKAAGIHPIRRWDRQGQGDFVDLPISKDRIADLTALPPGKMVFGSEGPAWGMVSDAGKPVRIQDATTVDFRGLGRGLLLDATGTRVGFTDKRGGQVPVLFSVSEHMLTVGPAGQDKLRPPRMSYPGLDLKAGAAVLSMAVAEDGQSYVMGTQTSLRAYAGTGQQRWEVPVPAAAWAVNLSADGRLVVAALGDGTLRWYRGDDGKELLGLLLHADHKRWALFTPSGYYDAAPGGDDLLGWHKNQGASAEADFFRLALFRDHRYRPDVIARVLRTLDEDRALAEADSETGRSEQAIPLAWLLPPVVTVLSPLEEEQADRSDMVVWVLVRAPSGEPVTWVRALINGRAVKNVKDRDVGVMKPEPRKVQQRPGEVEYSIPVSLPAEDSTLAVVAETALAKSEPALVHLRWAGKSPVFKPKLYVLAVGVSKYRRSDLRLEYSAKDAGDLAAEFRKQQGKLYREVEVRVLADRDATKDNILDGLEWLQRQTTARDVAVLFLAGHGINEPSTGDYYYLPYDADPKAIKRTMIFGGEVQSTLKNIPGKVLVFLDACHSGNVLGPGLFRGLSDPSPFVSEISNAENGVVVFASSTGRQVSKESPLWRNGAFTRALVEGLRGRAAIDESRRITVNMLDLYLSERVKRLTDGLQTPTTARSNLLSDFPVAVGVEKPQELPVYALPKPLHKRWWLWTAVGAVAAGAAVGIAVGVTRASGSNGPVLGPF